MTPPAKDAYSQVAEDQLDTSKEVDLDLYRDLVEVCEAILDEPKAYRASAPAVAAQSGILLRTPVPRRAPYKVFWSTDDPRIEAIFPYT